MWTGSGVRASAGGVAMLKGCDHYRDDKSVFIATVSGSAGIEGSSISPNERVIVSLQDGSGWAIATGYVKAVLTSGVEVTIDR